MADIPEDPRIAAALARNERYVREFVEAFNLCPYARRCRETGKLQRVVLLNPGGAAGTPEFHAADHGDRLWPRGSDQGRQGDRYR